MKNNEREQKSVKSKIIAPPFIPLYASIPLLSSFS